MGVSFLEWKIAEQWYRMSPKHQAKEWQERVDENPKRKDDVDLQKFTQDMLAKKNNGTENLIMSMYNIVRDSFMTTNAPNNPVRLLKAGHIGQIMKLIQDRMGLLANIGSLHKQQATENSNILKKLKSLDDEINKINSEISKLKLAIKKEKDPQVEEKLIEYKQRAEAIGKEKKLLNEAKKIVAIKDPQEYNFAQLHLELMTMLNGLGFKNPKGDLLSWNRFVDALVESLKECTGENPIYAQHTTQGLLLSYLLAKTNTKEDLQEYFRALLGQEDFILPQGRYSSEDIFKILNSTTPANVGNFEVFADLVSAYTFKQKYAANFPKVVDNKEATYHGISFADCMDTTMRMLTNIVTYQDAEGEVGIVPHDLDVHLNPVIKNFYTSSPLNRQSSEVGHAVHQAWAQVIEDVPG